MRPGICKTAGLKLVYTPLNGTGNVPVRRILAGHRHRRTSPLCPSRSCPDGNFPTCPLSQPGDPRRRWSWALQLAETDRRGPAAWPPTPMPTASALRSSDGRASYMLLTGNEVGVLLLDYICTGRIENGTMPQESGGGQAALSPPAWQTRWQKNYGVELPICADRLQVYRRDRSIMLEAEGRGRAALSSALRRATAIWPAPMCAIRTPWSPACSSARWRPTTRSAGLLRAWRRLDAHVQGRTARWLHKVDSLAFDGPCRDGDDEEP